MKYTEIMKNVESKKATISSGHFSMKRFSLQLRSLEFEVISTSMCYAEYV